MFRTIFKIAKIFIAVAGIYFIYSKIDKNFNITKPFKSVFSSTVNGMKSLFNFTKTEGPKAIIGY